MSLVGNPTAAIMEAKSSRNLGATMGVLFMLSLIAAITMGIVTGISNIVTGLIMAVMTFFGLFIGVMFTGVLASLAMGTLGGRGGFFEGLTCITYAIFLPVLGVCISLFLMLLFGLLAGATRETILITIGFVMMIPVLMFALVMGAATLFRSLRELFSTDMITAFVGFVVLELGIGIVAMVVMSALQVIGTMGMYSAMPSYGSLGYTRYYY